ncbi:unnamed protein product [Mucor fragilis]
MKAADSMYAKSERDETNAFLYEENIKNQYQCLKESKLLDHYYWYENEKKIRAASNMKRTLNYALCKERPDRQNQRSKIAVYLILFLLYSTKYHTNVQGRVKSKIGFYTKKCERRQ